MIQLGMGKLIDGRGRFEPVSPDYARDSARKMLSEECIAGGLAELSPAELGILADRLRGVVRDNVVQLQRRNNPNHA